MAVTSQSSPDGANAVHLLSGRWALPILAELARGGHRYQDLHDALDGISYKMLTETLRSMEADGLVERRVLKDTAPQHVEYALTALGATLREPLAAICSWAAEHA